MMLISHYLCFIYVILKILECLNYEFNLNVNRDKWEPLLSDFRLEQLAQPVYPGACFDLARSIVWSTTKKPIPRFKRTVVNKKVRGTNSLVTVFYNNAGFFRDV